MTSATRPRARSAPARLGEAALRSVREAAPRALAALGALLAGYDLGLLAGFLATESFVYDYCVDWRNFMREDCKAPLAELPAAWTALLARFVAAHLAGCLVGVLLAPRLADRFGRRPVAVGAALLFCAAAGGTMYSPPHWRRMLLWIRAAQGLAVGALSAALSLLAAELAPPAARKQLEHSTRLAAAVGLVLANGANLVMERRLHGWRRANGAAALAVLAALFTLWLVPESPAWVLARRGRDAAEKVLRRLRHSPKAAQLELEQLALQAADAAKAAQLAAQLAAHRPVNYKPLLTAALLEVLRQATGVCAVLTFGPLVFQDVARAGFRAAALLSLAYLLGAALAEQCRRALGRRRLLLLGAAGMAAAHCATAAGYRVLCAQDAALPDDARCSDAAGWLLCWTTAAFVCCFAASWGSATLSQSLDSDDSAALQSCGPALSAVAAVGSGAAVAHAAALLLPRAPLGDLFFVLAWLCGYAGLFVYVFCPERGPLDPNGKQQPSTAAGSLLKIV